jgi:hypothetical protein
MTFAHDRAQDWDFLAAWQPNVIRLMVQGNHTDPNSVSVPLIERVHATCPDALILVRVWDVDDRNYEAHAAMAQDPKREAAAQVDWWTRLFDRIQGVPRTQLMAGLNNETGPEKDGALYTYTQAALELATQRAVRLGVFVFSVGRPSLAGESQYDIAYFSQLDDLILANRGAVVLHEYMQPEGMYAVWTDDQGNERKDYTYLIGRHTRWAIKAPVIIGEWSIDGILYNRHPHPEYGNNGWHSFSEWPPTRYADEYVECVRQSSDNVIGICPFLSDNGDSTGKWKSFDVLEAYSELLKRKELCVKDSAPVQPPVTIHLPYVPGAGAYFVNVAAGANLRTGPGAEHNIITAAPYGASLTLLESSVNRDWYHVRYDGRLGWVYSALLSSIKPPVTVHLPSIEAPQPAGDNWTRSRAFVAKWEGGFTDNPIDHGNWTGGRQGLGELRGTNFGISAASYPTLDIRNLTIQQADDIYFRDYWQASGADKLAWPYCLFVLDSAVLHGVGAALAWRAGVGDNSYAFAAKRLRVYTKADNGEIFWRGWVNRVADLLEEASA